MNGKLALPFLLALLAALVLFSGQSAEAVRNALVLCATALIPALFPFMVLSKLLAGAVSDGALRRLDPPARRLFGVNGACLAAVLISLLGGYPLGVSVLSALYSRGAVTRPEAERTLRFCNNSGPGFFVGFLGGAVLHSLRLGLLLYLCHALSAILCGVLFSQPRSLLLRPLPKKDAPSSVPERFLSAVSESSAAMLQVCALVLIFSVPAALLEALLSFLPRGIQALLLGCLELTTGLSRLGEGQEAIASFLMGWGGLCVHMQAYSLWQKAGLAPRGYLLSKLLHGVIAALMTLTLSNPPVLFCGLLVFCVVISLLRKKYSGNSRKSAV